MTAHAIDDPYNLMRFINAQNRHGTFASALAELRAVRKQGHWMWYIFPQLPLGRSSTAQGFAISGRAEAAAYLAHPVLGPRLMESVEALLALDPSQSAISVLGQTDTMKLRSSATLFAAVSPDGSVFHRVLERFYDGAADARTHELLQGASF